MAMKVLQAFLYLCIFDQSSGQPIQVGTYVTQDDLDMASQAAAKAEQACAIASSMTIEDRATARAQLEDASANNILLEIMQAARNQNELQTLAAEKLPGAMIGAAAPLIMFFIILIIYALICCWTACPFCKCCRCCQRQRNIPFLVKLIALVLIGSFVLALVIVSSLSTRGYASAQEGFDVTNCAAATLVNSTFTGQSDPYFLGLIPVLSIFDELEGSLSSGSSFINDLRAILLDTSVITDSVAVATENVNLLASMLSDTRNTAPAGTLHECLACTPLATSLSQVSNALSSGTAAALSAARVEVDNQLSGSSLTTLRASLTGATAPLVELKTTIKSAFAPFVSDTLMEQISEQLNANGTIASVFMIGLALILSLCAMIAVLLWMCWEKSSSPDYADRKQYHKTVHRCACCTWCCSCYYTMLAFFLGGLLTILAVPLASMCLIMEDISSGLLTDISGVMEVDMSGEQGAMMGKMIDQCLKNASGNPRLLDLITVDDVNGNPTTMYDLLVVQTQDQITSQFDQIGATVNSGGGAGIAGSAEFVTLKSMLQTVALDSLMVPSTSYAWESDPDYQGIFLNSEIAPFIASSARCTSETIPMNLGLPKEGEPVSGINAFLSTMTSSYTLSSTSRSPTCAADFTCKALGVGANDLNATDRAACEAARKLMDLKYDMRSRNFKCYHFMRDGVVPCDVSSMSQLGNGAWTGDCKNADGTFTVASYDCDLAAFVQLVQDYGGYLDLVFTRLDGSTTAALNKIQVDLKALLDSNFLSKITTIGNGVTCGFMGDAYQNVVEGLCYGGVWGIKAVASSYTACAVLTLLLIILMYIQWRLALDNVNSNVKILDHTAVVPA